MCIYGSLCPAHLLTRHIRFCPFLPTLSTKEGSYVAGRCGPEGWGVGVCVGRKSHLPHLRVMKESGLSIISYVPDQR